MRDAPFTEADVSYLLKAKKFIHSKVRDNTANEAAPFIEVVYRINRLDRPKEDILLRMTARRTKALSWRLTKPRPSAALLWHNHRVRGIDRKIVHDVIKNGVVVDRVRGWHEHRWSSADGDKSVIGINEEMKNIQEDFGNYPLAVGSDGVYYIWDETIYSGSGCPLQIVRAINLSLIQQSIVDSVCYLYSTEKAAKAGEEEGGTAFIVSVPVDPSEPNVCSFYAITARHNIEDFHCPVVRINRQKGNADPIPLALNQWLPHLAGDDIAAAHLGFLNTAHFRFSSIAREMLITKEVIQRLSIGLGDEVSMVGRFVHHEGKTQNRPALRSGVISVMPEADNGIAFTSDSNAFKQEAFLIEMRSLAGYSGSPVVFTLPLTFTTPTPYTRTLPQDGTKTRVGPWLLGIDVGAFIEYKEVFKVERRKGVVTKRSKTDYEAKSHTNHSIVIPAWKLDELLDREEFKVARRKEYEKLRAKREDVRSLEKVEKHGARDSEDLSREGFESILRQVSKKIPDSELKDSDKTK